MLFQPMEPCQTERTLERLDLWMYGKCVRVYSDGFGEALRERFTRALLDTNDIDLYSLAVNENIGRNFERQKALERAKTFFTDTYNGIEGLALGLATCPDGRPRAKGVYRERLQPVVRSLKVFRGFLRNVRSHGDPFLVTDALIDMEFKQGFGGVEGYLSWFEHMRDVSGVANDLIAGHHEASPHEPLQDIVEPVLKDALRTVLSA
jgi:hypothetical protein